MTQQTTVERIETILRRDLDVDVIVSRGGDPHYNEPDIVGVNVAAQTIAAEIDALTRERDEARAELAGLDAGMRFQFDRAEDYKAQRDEARAEVESCRKAYAQMRSTEDEWKRDTLAALKAEVERLRPAAEAWEKQEYYDSLRIAPISEVLSAEKAMKVAASVARATRAAKERKP